MGQFNFIVKILSYSRFFCKFVSSNFIFVRTMRIHVSEIRKKQIY